MEGTCAYSSLEVDGKTVLASLWGKSFVLIDGARFRVESPKANYQGIFTIDIEPTPHWIGLARSLPLDGHEAVYCMGAPGAPRPSDFSCDTGSGRTLSRWKRKA